MECTLSSFPFNICEISSDFSSFISHFCICVFSLFLLPCLTCLDIYQFTLCFQCTRFLFHWFSLSYFCFQFHRFLLRFLSLPSFCLFGVNFPFFYSFLKWKHWFLILELSSFLKYSFNGKKCPLSITIAVFQNFGILYFHFCLFQNMFNLLWDFLSNPWVI